MRGFLLGIIIVGIGFAVVYYSAYFRDRFGRSQRMERNLGGTRVGYMLFGMAVMFIGFLILFGLISTSSTNDITDLQLGNDRPTINVQE